MLNIRIAPAAIAAFSLLLSIGGCEKRPDFESLKSEGKPIIAAIEKYKAANGLYPNFLAQCEVTIPRSGYGGWRYQSFNDGAKFELSVGNYVDDGFNLRWNSGNGDWYLDS